MTTVLEISKPLINRPMQASDSASSHVSLDHFVETRANKSLPNKNADDDGVG